MTYKKGISIPPNLAFWVIAGLIMAFVALLVLQGPVLSSLLKGTPPSIFSIIQS